MIRGKFNIGNILVYLMCAVTILSVFVPYISAIHYEEISIHEHIQARVNYNLVNIDKGAIEGWLILILVIMVVILNLLRLHLINLIIVVIEFILMIIASIKYSSGWYALLGHLEFGYILLIISSVLLLISSILAFVLGLNRKSKDIRGE